MSAAGPELPPHLLAKRKRQAELEEASASAEKPAPEPGTPPEKKTRVLGPSRPPAPLDERPSQPAVNPGGDSDSDSDDDWGPAPPPTGAEAEALQAAEIKREDAYRQAEPKEAPKAKRDDWMMIPPSQDDLAARMDPTRIRARKFNTGKSAKGAAGSGEIGAIWTETPEQKLQRLQNEAMGISTATTESSAATSKSKRDEEMARRVKEHTDKNRGKSLVEQHQKRSDKEEEDDPTKRAFDYQKDMGSGTRIGEAQKAEMLKKAKGFGSRFSGGSYL